MNYYDDHQMPYFDETGIPWNIDIKFDVLLTDREAVLRELRKNGLDLVEGQRRMKVMVIRDALK